LPLIIDKRTVIVIWLDQCRCNGAARATLTALATSDDDVNLKAGGEREVEVECGLDQACARQKPSGSNTGIQMEQEG